MFVLQTYRWSKKSYAKTQRFVQEAANRGLNRLFLGFFWKVEDLKMVVTWDHCCKNLAKFAPVLSFLPSCVHVDVAENYKKSQKKRECGSEPGRGGQKRQRLTWRERIERGGQADHLPESGSDCDEGPFARRGPSRKPPIPSFTGAWRSGSRCFQSSPHAITHPRLDSGETLLKHHLPSPRVASPLSSLPSVCL